MVARKLSRSSAQIEYSIDILFLFCHFERFLVLDMRLASEKNECNNTISQDSK